MANSVSNPSATASDQYTASQWTRETMLNDLMQQKWLLVVAGSFLVGLWLFSRRAAPEEQAARRLVRDWRHVDDVDEARDLLGENVPTILKPALLSALDEIEQQVHHWFRRVERDVQRL